MTWESPRDLSPVPGAGAISSSGGACVDQGGTEDRTKLGCLFSYTHDIASMGLVYLPTCTFTFFFYKKQPNVGKYNIHGWYGHGTVDGRNPAPVDR